MKKIVSLVLSVLLTFTLAGCSTSPLVPSEDVSKELRLSLIVTS